jgi:hypothetical protein
MQIIYSEAEKRYTLEALSRKGSKRPPSWKLIHSEPCGADEEKFNHAQLLDRLSVRFRLENSKQEFAVAVVSNPDAQSTLDRGVLKTRYRYVLSAAHQGQSLIKPNSREFCVSLINQNKLFRLEDINMMSFRGANPIASKNYSIFRLRGHWNCRHTWQREVYLVERDNSTVDNNQLINKTLEMTDTKNGLVSKFKELLSTSKTPLTMSEAVELSQMATKNANQQFKDVKIGEDTLRIDGDEMKEGVAVAWVDAEGNMTPIENEEITIPEDKVVLVVKDSLIVEVKPVEAEMSEADKKKAADKEAADKKAAEGDGGEFNAEDSYKKLESKIDAIGSKFEKANNEKFSELTKSMTESIKAEFKNIPALSGESTKQNFSSGNSNDNKYAHLSETGN